ncbi:hypothetical protein Tco_1085326 [Tanacetum coccineum]
MHEGSWSLEPNDGLRRLWCSTLVLTYPLITVLRFSSNSNVDYPMVSRVHLTSIILVNKMERILALSSPPVRRAFSSRLRLQHLKEVRFQRRDADISS